MSDEGEIWDKIVDQMDNPEVEEFVKLSKVQDDPYTHEYIKGMIISLVNNDEKETRLLMPAAFIIILNDFENLQRKYNLLQESRDLTHMSSIKTPMSVPSIELTPHELRTVAGGGLLIDRERERMEAEIDKELDEILAPSEDDEMALARSILSKDI